MMYVRTATTGTDWQTVFLDVDETRVDEFHNAFKTPQESILLEQGLAEGWIIVIDQG
jgi:hypothetical protein